MRVLLLLLALAAAARAQPAPSPAALTDGARASLLTMVPGREVYSLFGHSALRVRDDSLGLDRTYNYGTFSFDQPFFVVRFLRGDLDYLLDTAPFADEQARYAWLGRPIIEQPLDVPPATVRALFDFLETNALPENRAYRYDFFWDNCSTRLVGALDTALAASGQPPLSLPDEAAPETFRELLAPYLAGTPLVDLGLNLALGAPGDRPATPRERTFLPLALADQFDRATVGGRPLVSSRDTLFWVAGAEGPAPAPPWPALVLWALAALGLAATVWQVRRPDARLLDGFDAALFGVVGLAGVLFALLWFGTSHDVMGPNWNLLWAWPTHLALAVALRRGTLGGRWRVYLVAAAVVAALATVLWLALPQRLPAALLPLVALLAVRAADRARRATPRPPLA
jgi:hypothetical protein